MSFPVHSAYSVLKTALDSAFVRIADEFAQDGVTVLMPTYSPTQGRLLSEFNRVGGNAHISGGKKNAPSFKNVPQYGLDFDTTAYINMFPKGMSEQIVGAIPDALLQDRKIALFAFITPPASWKKHIADRNLGTEVVASNEQNTRLFFENKGNLTHILREAGLGAYVIPTSYVQPGTSVEELKDLYHRMKNECDKVVVQPCIESYEPTRFIENEADFVALLSKAKIPFKVVRFIEGNEANFSFFVCNSRPADTGRGVTKCDLPQGIDYNDPASLALIEANAAAHGIDASNVFSVSGRATLKAVGDPLLANEPGDSIGNNIGHVYEPHIARQITEIGELLGRKMALCGKVGHAGADLIIDSTGKIWINEINDRQQGPTDQMSADAEAAGLPGLSRMAWFAHYADFTKDENMNLMAALRDNADGIHQEYMTSRGSFYIKAYATHDVSFDGQVEAQKDLPAGIYSVKRNIEGQWRWEYLGENAAQSPIDIASGEVRLKISSGSLKKGDKPLAGAEMFRITGVASGENSPFVIEDGVSGVSAAWRPLIEQLYTDCFGEGYIQKNPQYRAAGGEVPRNVKKPCAKMKKAA